MVDAGWESSRLPHEVLGLLEVPRSLGQLAESLGVTDARVLWYLGKLRETGRVVEDDGLWRDYRRFEPISAIDVMLDRDVAVLRYKSAIEISVGGREPGELEAWHLDCYRHTSTGWQIRWSQATLIT